ncbi:MAG: trypsin-like serine protease [Bdellovibrionales bacterium]|nr:trypsin-like serine protease [Bdellovibrionales bacterium]
MKLKISLVFCLALGISACSSGGDSAQKEYMDSKEVDKIINGIVRSSAELPQYVKIYTQYGEDEYGGCTGTAIGDKQILTAAHSVYNARAIVVEIGDDETAGTVAVERYHTGAGYDGTTPQDDIALLVLQNSAGLPVLPLTEQGFENGEPAMIAGFGLEDGVNGSFGVRRSGTVYIQDTTQDHFVAQYDGAQSNPCFGDSGGPLIKMLTDVEGNVTGTALAGLVSFGTHEACGMGDTTYYTKVTNFLDSLLALSPGTPVI